jgi:hypothetical protein
VKEKNLRVSTKPFPVLKPDSALPKVLSKAAKQKRKGASRCFGSGLTTISNAISVAQSLCPSSSHFRKECGERASRRECDRKKKDQKKRGKHTKGCSLLL